MCAVPATEPASHPSCVRHPSLADGATGALPVRVPNGSAGGPHGLGMLPAPGTGAAPACSIASPAPPLPLAVSAHSVRGVSTPAPATAPGARAVLIEQFTSPRPAGPSHAATATPTKENR